MENLIIFGGSFDPIHHGHLRMARYASLTLNADVVFVPAANPRWKEPTSSKEDRLNMLKIALAEEGTGAYFVDDFEMNNGSRVNYTIDTIKHFQTKYKNREFILLIGEDEAQSFPNWKDSKEIETLCHIVYIPRKGVDLDPKIISEYHMQRLPYEEAGDVSSRDIRTLRSLDLDPKVLEYIEEHNLYFIKTLLGMMTGERFLHSLSVAHLANDIARRNQFPNPQEAYVAGLLHDLGKELSLSEQKYLVNKDFSEFKDYPDWCLHQFASVSLAISRFGIDNPNVLEAIKYHATGKAHLSPLGKIIYSSDKIEPTRGYDSKWMIKKCLLNYYSGFLKVFEENMIYQKEKGLSIDNPLTKECSKLYLGEIR